MPDFEVKTNGMLPRKLWKVLFSSKKIPVQFLRFVCHFFPQYKRIIKKLKIKFFHVVPKGILIG